MKEVRTYGREDSFVKKELKVTAEWLEELKNVPEFWKGSLEDIEEVLSTIKRGRVTLGCKSAGGRNVYMVEYGERNQLNRTATYSSATCVNHKDIDCYADKKREGVKPCLFLIGCVHGAEFEGTVSLLNLIHLLETGKDFLGNENSLLLEMAQKLHLIIVPCANPDGRARFPYKTVHGLSFESFRYFAQGTWKNGELCGHPGCKKYHPILEYSDFLGCYFNDNGINIQHDVILPMAEETKFLMEVAQEFAPDIIVNIHGATDCAGHIIDSSMMPQKLRDEVVRFEWKLNTTFAKENYKYNLIPKSIKTNENFYEWNLTGALHLCCGGISVTYESNQGVSHAPGHPNTEVLSFEGIYRTHILLYQELYKYVIDIFEKRKKE